MKKIFLITSLCLISLHMFAQPGALDPTFGAGGKVSTAIGPIQAYGYDMALTPDGGIVMVGEIWNYALSFDFAVAKYKSDGSLDPSFGTGGIVTHGGALGQTFRAVAIQSDGKILAAGNTCPSGSNQDFVVVRYLPDGTLDNSFGTGGIATIVVNNFAIGYDVAIQADGKIVVGGYSTNGTDEDFALARFDSTGTVDTSFGTNGYVVTPIMNYVDYGNSLLIQPDGKIILSGRSSTPSGYFSAARYNTDGSLDNSFGTGGKITNFFSGTSICYASALQPDGKLLLAGMVNLKFAVARYKPNGIVDSSFGTNGIVTTDIYPNNDQGNGIALQPNGKIIVCGLVADNPDGDFGIVRYDSTGVPDPGFGTGGIVTTAFDTLTDWPFKVLVQPDGKILAGGWTGLPGNVAHFALTRYIGGEIAGMEGSAAEGFITVYPNPATEYVTIKCNPQSIEHSFTVLNAWGEEIIHQHILSPVTLLDVSHYPAGFYSIVVQAGDTKTVKKLIVQ